MSQSLGLDIALELEPFEYAIVNSVDLMVKFLPLFSRKGPAPGFF